MGIEIGAGNSTTIDVKDAVREAVSSAVSKLGDAKPLAAYITSTVDYDAAAVHAAFRAELGDDVELHGVTTSLGVLTADGVVVGEGGALACMLFGGEGVSACVASSTGEDPVAAGRAVANAVKERCPDTKVMLFNATPGEEEGMLRGIGEVLPDVPCQGGSAADHAIAGEWWLYQNDGVAKSGVSVLALGGDVKVGTAIITPYAATEHQGKVTGGDKRSLRAIDGEPAAQVLNGWLGGGIDAQVNGGGNVLAQTALNPIAIPVDTANGDKHFITVHPAHVHAESGHVDVFAEVNEGQTLCMLEGTVDGLVTALPGLVDKSLSHGQMSIDDVKAACLIFCAGCAGAVGGRLDEGLQQLKGGLGDTPLMGLCTFGEQGYVPGLGSVHQDLSLSLLLLG